MRVIITGGGTGGHVYPALSIADEIMARNPDTEIIFVGTERGLESRVVPAAGYKLETIDAAGFNRRNLLKNVKVLSSLAKGLAQCGRIIENFKPDIVVGTGGYVSGPMVFLASLKGIATCIHEQNAFPGVTNRLLGLTVSEIMTGFEASEKYFLRKNKVHYTGNPVRKEFYGITKKEAREALSVSEKQFRVLSAGGSGGAAVFNAIIKETMEILAAENISFTHVTGKRYYASFVKNFKEGGNAEVHPYIEDMAIHMAASDLIVSRAGAITVAEILKLEKPSLLIPSPNVTGNHQFHNALALSESGCAILLEESGLNGKVLADRIFRLYKDAGEMGKMKNSAESFKSTDATKSIVDRMMLL